MQSEEEVMYLDLTQDSVEGSGDQSVQNQKGVLMKLEGLALNLFSQLAQPEASSIKVYLSNRKGDGSMRTLTFPHRAKNSQPSIRPLAQMMRIIEISAQCIRTNTHVTKRDIYYRNVDLFVSQRVVDRLVDDLAATCGVARAALHICASAKGLYAGGLAFNESDDVAQVATLIPGEWTALHVHNDVKAIIVVEKEATFRLLLSLGVLNLLGTNSVLLITGKGQADLVTRKLVSALSQLRQVAFLVDADPFGIAILLTYIYGSKSLQHEQDMTCKNWLWLGLKPSDWQRCKITPQNGLLPLSKTDMSKIQQLQKNLLPDHLLDELSLMLTHNSKAELESLTLSSSGNLLRYITDGLDL